MSEALTTLPRLRLSALLSAKRSADSPISVSIVVVTQVGPLKTDFNGRVTIELIDNPGDAALSGALAVNAVNGIANFTDLKLSNGGKGLPARGVGRSRTRHPWRVDQSV